MERTSHLLRLRKSKSKYGFPELDDYSRVIKEEAFWSLWPSQSYKEAMEKEHDKIIGQKIKKIKINKFEGNKVLKVLDILWKMTTLMIITYKCFSMESC